MGNDRTPHERRTTVPDAARILGISAEAIRGRIRRGTLPVEREGGKVYVLLEGAAEDRTDADQTRTTGDRPGDRSQSDASALIFSKDETIASLREQLEQANERDRENRRLLAAALERIPPQLEAPPEARESTQQTVEQEQEIDTERARRKMAESTMREGMDEERWRREEAERERDELRRELFALRQQPGASETAEEQQGRGEPRPDAPGPQEGAQRRPWWRRVFGG
jgi:hypothetical protein